MQTEPSVIIGAITTIAAALIALLVAYGLNLTDQQIAATMAVVAALAPLVAGAIIRFRVWSPDAKQTAVDHAYTMGLEDKPPPVNPPT